MSNLLEFIPYGGSLAFAGSVGSGVSGAFTISKVSLIRPSAVTHANDMDQRFIPLNFSYDAPTQCVDIAAADMPTPALAPPGYYMLFIMNNHGHPSIGQFINLWGIAETSVQVAVGQSCQNPPINFQVRWNTTIPTDGADRVEIYAPGVSCPGTPTLFKDQSSPSGTYHLVNLTSSACTSGTWKVLIRSTKASLTSEVTCKEFQVTCISCPPPCRPSCELE